MSKKKSEKKSEENGNPAANEKNVVAGPATVDQTVNKQAREARGEEEKAKDDGGDASLRPKTFPNEDVLKHRDETKEARVKYLKSIGLDPEAPVTDGVHKVEAADVSDKMYSGVVTMQGYSGEYHQKVSQRIDIGAIARGWAWCEYAFKQHMGNNAVLESIDDKNETDPLLRTTYG
jgi:hypothetical protein